MSHAATIISSTTPVPAATAMPGIAPAKPARRHTIRDYPPRIGIPVAAMIMTMPAAPVAKAPAVPASVVTPVPDLLDSGLFQHLLYQQRSSWTGYRASRCTGCADSTKAESDCRIQKD